MKNSGPLITGILVLVLVTISILSGCTAIPDSQLKVVTSTSLISQIVDRVGGELVDVINIIPPAQCPGHFDVAPGDIQKLADADLFLLHGWQGEKFSEDLIDSANNPDLTTIRINVKVGENINWLSPPVQQAAVDKITETLSESDPDNTDVYHKQATEYKAIITAKTTELKNRLSEANLADVNVISAEQLTGLIKWAGLNVIRVFGHLDSLTPQLVQELVDAGTEENVTLVIDNLQNGQDAGAGIAEELDSKRIILTNFPGCYDGTDTWEETIDYNVNLILEAVGD
ncbi:metal ABC transporter substrate-binding protein [Chloroflexota bacterium]